ncbi:SET domain-containing protein-lysine N-methyltransferase [Patescibacteria group bacterium]|nr:SET domain-containing protein-lysine N-methyltransferase [Patescibacteria group bacterium]MBU1075098.1 SET domain-containing protein-lysine N-methyltransferase [Patescibacteria group bacterium]MBU1952297.1 SET domain-containing protein-lysine N-methyltransferase [Patescibacteria group bacterium]
MNNLHNTWSHRWLTPKAEIKRSPICSVGVFAKERIIKHEIIRITGGLIVPKSDANKYNQLLHYETDNAYLDISDDFLMAPTQEDLQLTATINHSCNPNAGFLDTITIIAIKDILPGEEVTWDYAFSQTTFSPFTCRCGQENCRITIKPDDWMLKGIQEKFGEYFSPYLKRHFIR